MYETFYNLKAEPFRLSPDHRFCYEHKAYTKARAYMAYAFMRAEGFVMVTGRPGTGKTTLIGDLVETLASDDVYTANLVCTQLRADDLLKSVAYSFGVGAAGVEKADLLERLNVLFHKWHRDNRRALLIVDEAQDLSPEAMEELRLLTNIQVDGKPLLQIFLLGQPELRDLILSPALEQVHQRIVAASHLQALEPDETEAYVRHRLEAVGWRGDPALSRAIFPLLFKFSEGVPRRINLICSRLLLHGAVEQRHQIGVGDVQTVISELQSENLAAGTGFLESDFAVEDEFEAPEYADEAQVEVPSDTLMEEPPAVEPETEAEPELEKARSAIPLRAVSGEDFTPREPDDDEREALGPIPPSEPDVRPIVAAASVPVADGGQDGVPEAAIEAPGQRRGAEGWEGRKRRAGWVRVIAWCLALLGLGLGAYVAFMGSQGYWPVDVGALLTPGSARQSGEVIESPTGSGDSAMSPEYVAEGPGSLSAPQELEAQQLQVQQANYPNDESREDALEQVAVDALSPGGLAASADTRAVAEDSLQGEATISPQVLTYVVEFDFDSSELTGSALQSLQEVASIMREAEHFVADIAGFSDTQGDASYNLRLSRKRADAVRQHLIANGIEAGRLKVEGKGVLGAEPPDVPGLRESSERIVTVELKKVEVSVTTEKLL